MGEHAVQNIMIFKTHYSFIILSALTFFSKKKSHYSFNLNCYLVLLVWQNCAQKKYSQIDVSLSQNNNYYAIKKKNKTTKFATGTKIQK